MVQAQALPPVRLLALHGFATHQLAYMLDSLVRVSRRVDWRPFRQHRERAVPEGPKGRALTSISEPALTTCTTAAFVPAR